MKTSLHQQMGQQLGLTPQLLQSIRLLHLTAVELDIEVNRALDDNPLLERVEDNDGDGDDVVAENAADADEATDADIEDVGSEVEEFDNFAVSDFTSTPGSDDTDPFERMTATATGGVREHILQQLALELDDARDLEICAWLLDHTDDMGYLEGDADVLATLARELFDIDALHFAALRQRILSCDPVGFGARDLRECLLAQLAQIAPTTPGRATAVRIVMDHLDALARHDSAELATLADATSKQVEQALRLIQTLDPKPGAALGTQEGRVIIPDVVVQKRNGRWVVSLNSRATPQVRVDAVQEGLLAKAADAPAAQRMRGLLQEARWLTRGLSMRYDTLLRTTRVIVERQGAFLERGAEGMLPMILREVAEAIGMHESSVSRITTGKYVQTPRGVFELKYFFSARLDGAEIAGVAVRAMVKRLIDAENAQAPLADDAIVVLLARQGIRIARRTVAKYRDLMHIRAAKERRRPCEASPSLLAASL